MPPSVSVPLALLFFGLFAWSSARPPPTRSGAGFFAGYLAYDMTHYYLHHGPPARASASGCVSCTCATTSRTTRRATESAPLTGISSSGRLSEAREFRPRRAETSIVCALTLRSRGFCRCVIVPPRRRANNELEGARCGEDPIAELKRELGPARSRSADRPAHLGAFMGRLEEEVERSRRHGHASVAVLDLDGFRPAERRHGRPGATQSSRRRQAARALHARSDVAARTSADEFTLMLPETNAEEAKQSSIASCSSSRPQRRPVERRLRLRRRRRAAQATQRRGTRGRRHGPRRRPRRRRRARVCGSPGADATASEDDPHRDAIVASPRPSSSATATPASTPRRSSTCSRAWPGPRP